MCYTLIYSISATIHTFTNQPVLFPQDPTVCVLFTYSPHAADTKPEEVLFAARFNRMHARTCALIFVTTNQNRSDPTTM